MRQARRIPLLLTLAAMCASAQPQPTFNQSIRPILSDHCFACHGPDAAHRQAGLRFDLPNGTRGHESEILRRIASADDSERMPPPDSGKPRLTAREIDLVRQ